MCVICTSFLLCIKDNDRHAYRTTTESTSKSLLGFTQFQPICGKNDIPLGTTTATGASTGNLTITTGTLVANVEGNVTGNVTGNADTATTLAAARDFTLTGQVTTDSATSFDGSGNAALAVSLAAAAITGQTAETSVANDDLILIYDTSEAALRKMTKSNFVSGLGGGGMSNFVIGDGTTTQTLMFVLIKIFQNSLCAYKLNFSSIVLAWHSRKEQLLVFVFV